jgi:hypothetical protein
LERTWPAKWFVIQLWKLFTLSFSGKYTKKIYMSYRMILCLSHSGNLFIPISWERLEKLKILQFSVYFREHCFLIKYFCLIMWFKYIFLKTCALSLSSFNLWKIFTNYLICETSPHCLTNLLIPDLLFSKNGFTLVMN